MTASAFSADYLLTKVEPAFWWSNMHNPDLQLLLYGKNLKGSTVEIDYPGVTVKGTQTTENANYLFVNLHIAPETKAGRFNINLGKEGQKNITYNYELKARDFESKRHQGFNSSDVMYLIMPDRFSNGNPEIDQAIGMFEGTDRKVPDARHGGDIQGVINHLDYIKNLGITSIWLNPVLENNMEAYSYHGYAITDLYRVDPRHGSNLLYKQYVNECHTRDLKVVMDMVFNHVGMKHWFIKDLPTHDWIHQFPSFTRSNFRASTLIDPNASEYDRNRMNNGWFDTHMPDLNQKNELLARYLIQNSIWWIEYAGIDGIRMDTQPYPDQAFMAQWAKEVREAYPTFTIVGESWLGKEAFTAYWSEGAQNRDGYQANLQSVTDFPVYYAITKALTEDEDWDTGMARVYETLAQDFLYGNPKNNLIFLDNHDVNRFFSTVKNNFSSYKMAVTFLLTTRGIPQVYSGTEILMTGTDKKGHGLMRKDFPGGWDTDNKNKFTAAGRTVTENEAFEYMQKLLQWRQGAEVVHTGKLTHFVPENGVYVYFRYNEESAVMVILNNDDDDQTLQTDRYREILTGYKRAVNVLTGEEVKDLGLVSIDAKSALVLELIK